MRFNKFFALPAVAGVLLSVFSCQKPQEQQDPSQEPDSSAGPVAPGTPVIKAADASIKAASGSYEIAYSIDNPVEGTALTAAMDAEQAPWLKTIGADNGKITVTVEDNLSSARTAVLTLSYKGAESVNITLTQEQWAFPEFGIEISNLTPFGATFTITRNAGYDGGYFFEVLNKTAWDRYVGDDNNHIGEFAFGSALYESDYAYLSRMKESMGHSSMAEMFAMLKSMYSSDPTTTMPYSGLSVDTDYMFIVYGMDTDGKQTTPMAFYQFRTGWSEESGLTFSGKATDVTENYATLTVTPSNNEEYWYMDWVSEIDLKKAGVDYSTVLQNSLKNASALLTAYSAEDILCKGPETLQASNLMPGTEYTVLAWGMKISYDEGGKASIAATTEPQVAFTFKTEGYLIVDDCTFKIDVLEVEDMDILVRVTPSNPETMYYTAFVEKSRMEGYDDEQAAQRIINMEQTRIDQNYYDAIENLSWANLPGMAGGTKEIWGRRDYGWTFAPEHTYRIYVFGVDLFGIRSTIVEAIDVNTAKAGQSKNHFNVTIDKINWQGMTYTVTPEVESEYWMPFFIETAELLPYRLADGSLDEKKVMHEIEEYYEDEILYNTYTGKRSLYQRVTPDTDYTLLVFGYAGTNTTRMYEWPIYAPKPPLGLGKADIDLKYELFRGEDLSAIDPIRWPLADYEGDCIMMIDITPTDNATHWYVGVWPPVENFVNEGGLYYLMTLDMNATVSAVDQTQYRTRPWWYGSTQNWEWVDEEGDVVKHWPWTLSGFAEDEDENYSEWHYEMFIPVPVPKGEETGKYEVGYTKAYDFWSTGKNVKVYSARKGAEIPVEPLPRRTFGHDR
ncbi:MAG: hypothetical protein IJ795_02270 [Bacteroidales bacterium]|nr:hypothetical protein [Bacteroidales bacterium]